MKLVIEIEDKQRYHNHEIAANVKRYFASSDYKSEIEEVDTWRLEKFSQATEVARLTELSDKIVEIVEEYYETLKTSDFVVSRISKNSV